MNGTITDETDNNNNSVCSDNDKGGSDIEDESETEALLPEEDQPILD